MPNVSRRVVGSGAIVALLLAVSPDWAAAQVKSGPRALDACNLATKAELEEALKKKVQARPVPPATPTSLGVSTCMWATANGRQTLVGDHVHARSAAAHADQDAGRRTTTRSRPATPTTPAVLPWCCRASHGMPRTFQRLARRRQS